jgi:beta-ribofuranosylaminobenzene 5'-phosphate synthase
VTVRASARLHLGFVDPGATLGRRYGSVGLVVEEPATRLSLRAAARDAFVAADADAQRRIGAHVQALREASGRGAALRVELHDALPAHAGLGSGTQLALAVGRAFAAAFGWRIDTADLVPLLGRGARSGIGSAGFDVGGLLVDGGPPHEGAAAPLLFRADFPDDWRVLLVQDASRVGLHGADEQRALAALPTFAQTDAARISHELLMRVMPAVLERDFAPFADGIATIQRLIGAHFAPAQGGDAFTSPAVGRLLRWLEGAHGAGIGQSSWGPTGFALLPSQRMAEHAVEAARAAGVADARLHLSIVRGRNRGADVITEDS